MLKLNHDPMSDEKCRARCVSAFFLLCVFFLLWQLVDGVQVLSFHGTIIALKVITVLITLFEKNKIKMHPA